jgi:hypothetical protein|tara:strand:+ start:600 stop:857 length:258 start_codon:yes stop_codon:yes gene_type:complete
MKSFINHYRQFRNEVFEECGDMEENDIMFLYSLYIENKHKVNPLAGLESFLKGYESLFPSRPNNDPDDEDFNDDPFSNSSGSGAV